MDEKITRETLEKFLYDVAENMSVMIMEDTEKRPLLLKALIARDGTSLYAGLVIGEHSCRYIVGYYDETDVPVIAAVIRRGTFEEILAFATSKRGKEAVVDGLLEVIKMINCDSLFTGKSSRGKKKKRRKKTWISFRKR